MQRRSVDVNGITLSYLEAGEGPAILLCHGFPETSQSWRKQIPVLAAAGYRAIAPDLRGYGESSCPEASDVYTMFHIVGDLIGLMDALSIERTVIVGNDWGASVAWQMALMRPDRIRGVAAFGVPMMARAPMPPTKLFPRTKEAMFYILYFQEPGLAEREVERDMPTTLRRIYHAASGEAGPRQPGDDTPNPFGMVVPERGILRDLPEPVSLPAWLSSADFNAFAAAFARSGFRGGLNYYRNLDRNWELQASLEGMHVEVPALFAIGSRDVGLTIPGMDHIIAGMSKLAPHLRRCVTIDDAGHWIQQERADEVNALILSFMPTLDDSTPARP
ncbi:alpha/beta fold hydrolase [Massilia dura]|uniref:Alpha/beta fold hydrolase n=1 Tax=Pseudoduganella dura TaxID=321982 RepID=A0A6I3XGQ7_9BURK|nr:alpha/beta hydrolase [Pseudoduganella dura]MUI10945.1 alpha/beta fold hydrolase [Pseudoduganella dura]GGY02913.1 epoxide hydrolase [Pseudoduganella dura]